MIYLKFKNNTIEKIKKKNVLTKMYYELAVIPSDEELANVLSDEELKKKINRKKMKKTLSKIDNYMPLYDIKTKNLYLIANDNIYARVTIDNYRLPDKHLYEQLKEIKDQYKNKKLDNEQIKYVEKLEKNINFLENYNFKILKQTYYKLFFLSSPTSREITSCKRLSYLPFTKLEPYYSVTELLNLALNMGLLKKEKITLKQINKLCKLIAKNDINAKILLHHQLYIRENNAIQYIHFYSLIGSQMINYYLRDLNKNVIYDKNTNDICKNMLNIIEKAPAFDKDYIFYRFVDNDDYLSGLKIGDKFVDKGIISVTRNPFYSPKKHYFGLVLLKIKIKKDIQGLGLCIEHFSHFEYEQEIMLYPCELRLVSKHDNFKYYHPDKEAQEKIKRKYEFEWIKKTEVNKYKKEKIEYSMINPLKLKLEFIRKELSNKKKIDIFSYFYLKEINKINPFYILQYKNLIFYFFSYENIGVYEKFFFFKKDFIFIFCYNINININKNKNDMAPVLVLEIDDIISVNYYNRYSGINTSDYIDDKDLIYISALLGYLFRSKYVIIHGNYSNFVNKKNDKFLDNTLENYDKLDIYNLYMYSASSTYFCVEIYEIIKSINKNEEIKYRFNDKYIKPLINIDFFKEINELKIENLKLQDQDPILKINDKMKFNKMLELYLYIHDNYFYLLYSLQNKILLAKNTNIDYFNSAIYMLDHETLLYTNKDIKLYTLTSRNMIEPDINITRRNLDRITNKERAITIT